MLPWVTQEIVNLSEGHSTLKSNLHKYGSRMVPGKKYILSGGRHLIYPAAAT